MTPSLSNSLKALVMATVTNGFPSVTSVLQHFVFKMSFHYVLFTASSPSPGGDEKVILIFQRSPVNYSIGLCIAYSLHWTFKTLHVWESCVLIPVLAIVNLGYITGPSLGLNFLICKTRDWYFPT